MIDSTTLHHEIALTICVWLVIIAVLVIAATCNSNGP